MQSNIINMAGWRTFPVGTRHLDLVNGKMYGLAMPLLGNEEKLEKPMGQIIQTNAQFGNNTSHGEVHLETDFILFRGDFRLKIKFKDITSIKAIDGKLEISFPDGKVMFHLGEKAEKWADKIKNPKSVIDKLGVRASSRVAILGVQDKKFLNDLAKRTKLVIQGEVLKDLDFIFYSAESIKDLRKVSSLKKCLKKDGAIWVVSRKGKEANIKDIDVMGASKRAGLVDVKVVGFSDTHTALKLVIPRDQRNQ